MGLKYEPRQVHKPPAYGAAGGGGGAGKHATAEEEVASQEEVASPAGKRRRAPVAAQEDVEADAPAAGARGAGRGGGSGAGPEGAGEGEARPSKEVRQLGSIFPSFTHYAAPLAERRAAAPPQNYNPSGRGGAVHAPAPEEESPAKRTRTAAEEEDRGLAGQRHVAEGRDEGEGAERARE